jgi:UDP-N-acetylmuramoylalanine--D-glutamate ligase
MVNMNLKDKKITVVGLGVSGLSAAKLLLRAGANVSVTDNGNGDNLHKNKKILDGMGIKKVETGNHTEGFIKGSEMLIVSPGVDTNSLPILWAEKKGIPIIGEIELAFSFCKAPIIAITGSNGKTTVTTMTGELLKAGGIKSYVCGNIGLPFCDIAMDAAHGDVVVLEVSSFQLTRTINFKP